CVRVPAPGRPAPPAAGASSVMTDSYPIGGGETPARSPQRPARQRAPCEQAQPAAAGLTGPTLATGWRRSGSRVSRMPANRWRWALPGGWAALAS
ncbi:MAG TPA: hypothetical protein VGI96_18580, partial [Streptosporangiaceae bacterium]